MNLPIKRTTCKSKMTAKQEPLPQKDYAEYERREAELPDDLTQKQYDQALQRIAREFGV